MGSGDIIAIARTMAVDAVTVRVVTAFRSASIEPVVLKGPSFAAWLYGEGRLRSYVDTDLLIPPAAESAASQVLRRLGYLPETAMPGPVPHATTWRHRDGGVEVDLHTRLPLTSADAETWSCLKQHTEALALGGATVSVLDEPGKALHVVIHALQNSLSSDRTTADLTTALSVAPDEVWRDAAHLAAQLGAQGAFAAGLAASPPGVALCRRIGVHPAQPLPVTIQLLAHGAVSSGAPALAHFSQLVGWRARLAFAGRKMLPPPSYVRSLSTFGGPPSSKTMPSYAFYWLRLLRKAPGAVRAWRAVRGKPSRAMRSDRIAS